MQNILLAAGLAARSGGEKLFFSYQGQPIIHHAVAASLQAGLYTVVVTGHRAAEVERAIADLASPLLVVVENPHYRSGQGSSTQAGAALLRPDLPFFISLSDMPLLEADHYRALMGAYREQPLRPRYEDKVGHPVLLPPSFIPIIASRALPFTMRELLSAYPMEYLQTTEEAYVLDVDTASSFQNLVRRSTRRP